MFLTRTTWRPLLQATLSALMGVGAALGPSAAQAQTPAGKYTLFESLQVRPLAQSPDGSRLFALNTPDNALEVFDIQAGGALRKVASIPVGLEPVAVAARSNDEVWVVNHVSDSVSVVSISKKRVVNTLWVGDEPRDIVFAGPASGRAFITTAHRGQNTGRDPELFKAGIGRADVWVFDAATASSNVTIGGKPLGVVTLFSDTPRALAVSPDKSRVYVAGYQTGNQTSVIPNDIVIANGGLPAPQTNTKGEAQPSVGLIVKYDGKAWRDEAGRDWSRFVRLNLPDRDVFVIDANAAVPKAIDGSAGYYTGVGTTLYNMAVNPVSGKVFVSNLEALNHIRFEDKLRGHFVENRISILGSGGAVSTRHLNKHINYSQCCSPVPNDENRRSLALPMDMVFSGNGQTLYVAAHGSGKVGVLNTAELEANTFTPDAASQIQLSGGGPSGLALDEARGRLYVLTRFNNAVSVVDTATRKELSSVKLDNPEPAAIVNGRRFLYDASYTSSHGDSACASCHTGGDMDQLAWDLGSPLGETLNNPGPFRIIAPSSTAHFRPMKGPMTTQSLRGMANHGPMHWRGDRTGGNDGKTAQPNAGGYDERAAFAKFNPAFVGLLGRDQPLSDAEMSAFTDFALQLMYPPNPIRKLDNTLTASQQTGRNFYMNRLSDRLFSCNGCHALDPKGNASAGVDKPGFFGTDGRYSFENETQVFKIPQLRNMYQKVGMFGMAFIDKHLPDRLGQVDGQNPHMGDQIRGFGFSHDGSRDVLQRFLSSSLFRGAFNFGFASGDAGWVQRDQVVDFIMAYDSNHAPIVGQQVTLNSANAANGGARVDLLVARAKAGECELTAVASPTQTYLMNSAGSFASLSGQSATTDASLRGTAKSGNEVTYTCAPLGGGATVARNRPVPP